MLQKFFSSSSKNSQLSHLIALENCYKDAQAFYKRIELWKNIEINYVFKMNELCQSIKTPSKFYPYELSQIFKNILQSHSKLLSKIDLDIFGIEKQSCNKILEEFKKIIQDEKLVCLDFNHQRQILQKTLQKKDKLMKNLQQQLMMQVFLEDSVEATMQKKIRIFSKIKEMELEMQAYQIKIDQIHQNLHKTKERSELNIFQSNKSLQQLTKNRVQVISKLTTHIYNQYKSLVQQMKEINTKTLLNINNQETIQKIPNNSQQFDVQQRQLLFLHYTLKQIQDKSLDDILEYFKNNQIKGKIKKILENKQLAPEQTDQLVRQVKAFQKLIKNTKDTEAMKCFVNFINKNIKFRINFIFILQTFRLMSQFQISQQASRGIMIMIEEVIACCQKNNDTFCLKNIMALLSTYYVQIKDQRVYLLQFFKENKVWKCIQFWQAALIQSIYIQKKKTMKMYMSNSDNLSKKDILTTQSLAISSQMLYVVKNMVIFGFTQRQVKNFAYRFNKKLNQDPSSLKDVYKSIENAILQEQKEYLQNQKQLAKGYKSEVYTQ